MYVYTCDRIEKGEVDYPSTSPGAQYTFDEINDGFLNAGYTSSSLFTLTTVNCTGLSLHVHSVLNAL